MKLLQRHRAEFVIFGLIILVYFAFRLPQLTSQPIFADEAIYVRWAQIMRSEPGLRFVPLQDGKTPLYMWSMIPLFKVFDDPLLAGRVLSVLAGFMTLIGVFLLSWKFFSLKTALWAALLVAVVPFMVFFDRMALVDSLLAAFTIWTAFISLMLIKHPRFDLAMLLGYLLGGGILTKTPGIINFGLITTSILTFSLKQKNKLPRFLRVLLLWGIALAIGFAMFNILRLSPDFVALSNRDSDYLRPAQNLLKNPFDPLIPFGKDLLFGFYPLLLTLPVFILGLIGLGVGLVRRNWVVAVLFLWILIPLLFELTMLQVFTARYMLLTVPQLLVLAAYGIQSILEKFSSKQLGPMLIGVLGVIVLLHPLYFTGLLLSNPPAVPLPRNEHRGYFEDWTAGYGFPEIAEYLIQQSQSSKVIVGTEGAFGTLPDGLLLYLDEHLKTAPATQKIIVLPGGPSVSETVRNFAREGKSYFVTNKIRYPNPEPGLTLIKEFPKAQGPANLHDAILLYEVNPI